MLPAGGGLCLSSKPAPPPTAPHGTKRMFIVPPAHYPCASGKPPARAGKSDRRSLCGTEPKKSQEAAGGMMKPAGPGLASPSEPSSAPWGLPAPRLKSAQFRGWFHISDDEMMPAAQTDGTLVPADGREDRLPPHLSAAALLPGGNTVRLSSFIPTREHLIPFVSVECGVREQQLGWD